MKNKIFTLALTFMGSTFLFAQQWTGTNNTTSDISRTGKVSINTPYTTGNLNLQGSIGFHTGANLPNSDINFYNIHVLSPNPSHVITARTKSIQSMGTTILSPILYIGSVANKSLVFFGDKIGMGTEEFNCSDCADYRFFVKDGIRTEKIKVDIAANNGWADYVFEADYKLMPLTEVEQFIKQNGHLPEVPTTAEAIENGIELKEMNILLLKKVEELTLYSIELQKRIEALESKTTK